MAQSQILTYPWGTKYQWTDWEDQVKDGKGGSIPCNNEIFRGRAVQNEWWSSNDGQDNASDIQENNEHFEQPVLGNQQKGLCFWASTDVNGYRKACWFDIGAEGGKEDGSNMDGAARSSWLREVTALWFMFNSHDTTDTRGCYSQIEKAGIRYRDPNGKIKIKQVTEKLGDYEMGGGRRKGDPKIMFGYAIPSNDRQTICRNNWRFLGLRIQICLVREKGPQTDYIQGGVTGIRLGLGDVYNNWNTNNKRALVLRGNTTYTDFTDSDTKDMLETRQLYNRIDGLIRTNGHIKSQRYSFS